MPSRPWPLWLLTAVVLLGFPALNFVYWPLVLEAGVLPANADSVGIPMFLSLILTAFISPFVLAVAWLCLRRYNPATRIAAWRRDRPWRSAIATLLLGGAAACVAAAIVADLGVLWPWYDYVWPAYCMCLLLWLVALRAAVIDQLEEHDPLLEARTW